MGGRIGGFGRRRWKRWVQFYWQTENNKIKSLTIIFISLCHSQTGGHGPLGGHDVIESESAAGQIYEIFFIFLNCYNVKKKITIFKFLFYKVWPLVLYSIYIYFYICCWITILPQPMTVEDHSIAPYRYDTYHNAGATIRYIAKTEYRNISVYQYIFFKCPYYSEKYFVKIITTYISIQQQQLH